MTTLEKQIEEKRTLVNGMLKQAKGITQEQWSNLSNDEKARLVGKKDQVVGKLQRDYGNSWAVEERPLPSSPLSLPSSSPAKTVRKK